MTPTKKPDAEKRNAEREAALTFVRMAKEKGLDLTGPDGLLKQFTKSVLETALDEEMTEHLGRAKHKKSKDGRAANTRNGTTAKTVVTDSVGPVRIEVPRDRDGSFEPVVVRKRQRRLPGVDEVVLSLYARGLTTGEISAHFQEIYGADVSRETVSRITERVVAEKDEWCSRVFCQVGVCVLCSVFPQCRQRVFRRVCGIGRCLSALCCCCVVGLFGHEGVFAPVGAAFESDEPSVVDGAVDEGGGHVLVAEHASPSAEFDVGGVDDAPCLVAVGDDLEEETAAFLVYGQVAELVDDQ